MKKLAVLLSLLLLSSTSWANYVELGVSGSYRKTSYDKKNYYEYKSVTGSVAYYFWEMSALEFSYTRATTEEKKTDYVSRSFIEMYGMDFIFSMASRESLFQPYVKFGAAYQQKESSYKFTTHDAVELDPIKGIAPSAGLGFKLIFAGNFALKCGLDVWSSPISSSESTFDYAARAGLSWIF